MLDIVKEFQKRHSNSKPIIVVDAAILILLSISQYTIRLQRIFINIISQPRQRLQRFETGLLDTRASL